MIEAGGTGMVFVQNIATIHPCIQQLRLMTKKSTLYQKGVFCKVRKEELKCILYNDKIVMQMRNRQAVRLPCVQINCKRIEVVAFQGHSVAWVGGSLSVLLNNGAVSFSRVKQAKKNVGLGGHVYVCRGQYNWCLLGR